MYPRWKWHVYQGLKSRIKSTAAQALARRFHKRQFDGCTSVDSTIVKRRIDGYNCRIDGYIDYFKKSIRIFRCPFSATVLADDLILLLRMNELILFHSDLLNSCLLKKILLLALHSS